MRAIGAVLYDYVVSKVSQAEEEHQQLLLKLLVTCRPHASLESRVLMIDYPSIKSWWSATEEGAGCQGCFGAGGHRRQIEDHHP